LVVLSTTGHPGQSSMNSADLEAACASKGMASTAFVAGRLMVEGMRNAWLNPARARRLPTFVKCMFVIEGGDSFCYKMCVISLCVVR